MKNRKLLIQAFAVAVMGAVALVTAPSTASAAPQLDTCTECVDSCPTKAQMGAFCDANCPNSAGATCGLSDSSCWDGAGGGNYEVTCTVPI